MENKEAASQGVMMVSRFICSTCKNPVTTRVPSFRIVNQPEFSSVTCVHQIPVKCTSCDTFYIPVIKGIDNNMKLLVSWRNIQVAQPIKSEVPEQLATKQ